MAVSTKTPTLTAERRDRLGTRYARRLRALGRLPAVIYGHKKDPVAVSLDEKVTLDRLHRGERIFTISLGDSEEMCQVKDLQFDYLGTNVIHIDLKRIDLTEEITVNVRIRYSGTPVGLKTTGAILRVMHETIPVTCLATNVPSEEIELDISGLEAGGYLTAEAVAVPQGAKLATELNTIMCRIALVAEEAPVEAEAEVEPEITTEKVEEQQEEPSSES